MKKRILKWKCTICKTVEDAATKPLLCKDCGAQSNKIKALSYQLKKHSHADEPEMYE